MSINSKFIKPLYFTAAIGALGTTASIFLYVGLILANVKSLSDSGLKDVKDLDPSLAGQIKSASNANLAASASLLIFSGLAVIVGGLWVMKYSKTLSDQNRGEVESERTELINNHQSQSCISKHKDIFSVFGAGIAVPAVSSLALFLLYLSNVHYSATADKAGNLFNSIKACTYWYGENPDCSRDVTEDFAPSLCVSLNDFRCSILPNSHGYFTIWKVAIAMIAVPILISLLYIVAKGCEKAFRNDSADSDDSQSTPVMSS